MFLRIEFICIIWTFSHCIKPEVFVLEDWIYLYYLNFFALYKTEVFVLEDWIYLYYLNIAIENSDVTPFLRIEFICIIWTDLRKYFVSWGSWGLNLFVLFEHHLFKAFEWRVLEDWIYLYYLNKETLGLWNHKFLRIEFICIIWTLHKKNNKKICSWGLNLFVLFEPQLSF